MRKLPPLATLRAFEAAALHMSFKDAAEELGVTPTAIRFVCWRRSADAVCSAGDPAADADDGGRAPVPGPAEWSRCVRNGLRRALGRAGGAAAQSNEPERIRQPMAGTAAAAVAGSASRLPLEVIGTDALIDLRAGEADVAIRYARTTPTEFISREVFRDRYFPVCNPALLAGQRASA